MELVVREQIVIRDESSYIKVNRESEGNYHV